MMMTTMAMMLLMTMLMMMMKNLPMEEDWRSDCSCCVCAVALSEKPGHLDFGILHLELFLSLDFVLDFKQKRKHSNQDGCCFGWMFAIGGLNLGAGLRS